MRLCFGQIPNRFYINFGHFHPIRMNCIFRGFWHDLLKVIYLKYSINSGWRDVCKCKSHCWISVENQAFFDFQNLNTKNSNTTLSFHSQSHFQSTFDKSLGNVKSVRIWTLLMISIHFGHPWKKTLPKISL